MGGSGCGHPRHPATVGEPARRVRVGSRFVEETDRKILSLLASDGRMSFTDLGKATRLSTSAVHQRVKRLEQRGLIKGYGATVDHEQVGLPLTAFVSITPIDPAEPDDYPSRIDHISEIESCWSVAGRESYILKVRVAEPAGLEDLLARIRAAANVSTHTTVVLSTPFENRAVTGTPGRN
jgi:Lrp/AsnC family transcriptional regulator, leucine-responsive regulatory protein